MNRRWFGRWVWGLILAPQLGCVALPQAFMPPPSFTPPSAAESEKTLPAGETARVCLGLGESFAKQGHLSDAIVQYEKARLSNPRLDLSYKLALLYDQQGDYPHAVAEYEKAVAAHPRDGNLLNDFGYCHYNRGEWAKAEQWLRQAVEVDAKNGRAWVNLGMTLGMQERWEEARAAFGRVVGPVEVESNMGFLLAAKGKREEAKLAYQQVLAMEPNHPLARSALVKLSKPVPATEVKSPQPQLQPQVPQLGGRSNSGEQEVPPPMPRRTN